MKNTLFKFQLIKTTILKNSDWKILLTAIIYTLLFYKQENGLNFLIFNLVIILLAFLQNRNNIKRIPWLVVSIGALFSSFFVFYYATDLPKTANIISLMFLAGLTFNADSSLIISVLNSFTSYILAIQVFILNFIKSKTSTKEYTENLDKKTRNKKSLFKKIMLLIFPLFVVFVFFVLYRDSNPLFLKITEDINLDWLSADLVSTFLYALLIMYAFFIQNILKPIDDLDQKIKDDIKEIDEEKHNKSFFSKFLSLESETFTAITLFALLNVLILVLNAVDIYYLWLKNPLPQGLVFSEYLHSGTFSLIFSIVLAIFIIIFFFRGIFNFNKKGKLIKTLAFVWVAQNIVMIASAMLRNKMYIDSYSMTHKRIGVYVFLLLAIIGLIVTFTKIALKKNTAFLIRKNTWAFYFILIIATAINWDMIITRFNVKQANENYIVDLDKNYLTNLSHVNTYALFKIDSELEQNISFLYFNSNNYTSQLQRKLHTLLDYENRNNWQEYSVNKNRNIEYLKKMNEMGKISKLELFSNYLDEIPKYETLSNVKALDFSKNNLRNKLLSLENYKKLQVLNLSSNKIEKLDSLAFLNELKYLNISSNNIKDFNKLGTKTPNITHLDISGNKEFIEDDDFPVLDKLESINLSKTNTESWKFLSLQKNLKEIIYSYSNNFEIKIAEISSLKYVDLSNANNSQVSYFLDSLSVCKNITELKLNNSNISNINQLIDTNKTEALFQNLEILNLANNNLQDDIIETALMQNLKNLNLHNNTISEITALQFLYKIEYLDLSVNKIKDFKALIGLKSLLYLNISHNKLGNINSIANIQNLKTLDVSNNKIKHIDTILKLKNNLEVLNISHNRIKDISILKEMKKIKDLYIRGNNIENFDVLFEMDSLKYVSIGKIDLSIIEKLKEKRPKLIIDYFSNNLNHDIKYNNNKRIDFITDF